MPKRPIKLSSKIRKHLGLDEHSRIPVCVVGGSQEPTIVGESWGWETRTGIPIRHPTAYSKVGWSSMVYRASTKRIEVGEEWLLNFRG